MHVPIKARCRCICRVRVRAWLQKDVAQAHVTQDVYAHEGGTLFSPKILILHTYTNIVYLPFLFLYLHKYIYIYPLEILQLIIIC